MIYQISVCDRCGKMIGTSFERVSLGFSDKDKNVDILLCPECAKKMYQIKEDFTKSKKKIKEMTEKEFCEQILNEK